MQGMARMVCIAGLLSSGCAAMADGPRCEILYVVETDQDIGRLVFSGEGGMPFQLANAPEGVTIYRQLVRPGTYCLQEVTSGNLTFGYTFRVSPPACTQVEAGQRVYGGHILVSEAGVRGGRNLERLQMQLQDPEVPVVASPPELGDIPFEFR